MNIDNTIKEVKENQAIILDVRRDDEWAEGHIKGAMHYDIVRIENGEIPAIPKDTIIYTHCRGGWRATRAVEALEKAGFTKVVCLGGYSDWKDAGGEVVE